MREDDTRSRSGRHERHLLRLGTWFGSAGLGVATEQTLGPLRGTVVLDEVQTMPGLLPRLRVLADRPQAKFLLLGSASPDLIRGASETLAGRVAFVYLNGFDLLFFSLRFNPPINELTLPNGNLRGRGIDFHPMFITD